MSITEQEYILVISIVDNEITQLELFITFLFTGLVKFQILNRLCVVFVLMHCAQHYDFEVNLLPIKLV